MEAFVFFMLEEHLKRTENEEKYRIFVISSLPIFSEKV